MTQAQIMAEYLRHEAAARKGPLRPEDVNAAIASTASALGIGDGDVRAAIRAASAGLWG